MQNNIFEQEVLCLTNEEPALTSSTPSSSSSSQGFSSGTNTDLSNVMPTYEPKFKHLWQPVNLLNTGDGRDIEMDDGEDISESVDGFGSITGSVSVKRNANFLKSKSMKSFGSDDGRSSITFDASGRKSFGGTTTSMKEKESILQEKLKRQKKPKEKLLLYTLSNGVVEVLDGNAPSEKPSTTSSKRGNQTTTSSDNPLSTFLGYSRPSILEFVPPMSVTKDASNIAGTGEPSLIHETMPGPRTVCRPEVPNFLSPLISRDEVKFYIVYSCLMLTIFLFLLCWVIEFIDLFITIGISTAIRITI